MTSTVLIRERYAETIVPGQRLGRHLAHDERSRAFPVRVNRTTTRSVRYKRTIGSLDQLNLGACVGNATTGVLATEPFAATMPSTFVPNEATAVDIYSRATRADSYPGSYPPTDTGTDGLSAAKVVKDELGLISGYEHALSWDQFLMGLSDRPGIIGIKWKTGCDNPDSRGLVRWTGTVRGGHEIEADEIDLANQVIGFDNSWGPDWGLAGRFYMSFTDVAAALKDDGDATFFVPNNEAPPIPVPVTRSLFAFEQDDVALIENWAKSPHVWSKATKAAPAWGRRSVYTPGSTA